MECISTNVYIFYEIFQYLNLKELLVLAKVCKKFRNFVIEYLEWKYKEVEAFKTPQHYFITNNVTKDFSLKLMRRINECDLLPQHENRILLSHDDFLEFINLNSNNIETLLLHFNDDYGADLTTRYYGDKEYFNQFKFNRLQKLGFGGMNLTEAQLNNMTNKCPNLKDVYMGGLIPKYNEVFWFNNIPFKTLDSKNIIKCLGYVELNLIDGYYSHREEPFVYLEHLINETNAQTNLINLKIENCSSSSNLSTKIEESSRYCEVLAVGQFIKRQTFIDFYEKTIKNLMNLRKLTIVSVNYIEIFKKFFVALNTNCKNLEYLELEYCNIQEFIPIYTLKELVLNYCLNLSWKDLIVMLSLQTKLKSFSSTLVHYKGKAENFNISKELQYLTLRYNKFDNHLITNNNFANLISLRWTSADLTNPMQINASNCPNVQTLEVRTSHLAFENIHEFKYLKKLTLNVSINLNFQDFWKILQHPTLIYLNVNYNPKQNFINYENYLTLYGIECSRSKTCVLFIDICYNNNCKYFMDFWLSLLSNNLNLKLRIKYNCLRTQYGYSEDECKYILNSILNNKQRPNSLKSINICGYNIDLIKFENNYAQSIEESNSISHDNFVNNKMQYILLKNHNV